MVKQDWLFPQTFSAMAESQKEMAQCVIKENDIKESLSFVAGMDVSNNLFDPQKKVYAAAVILDFKTLSLKETAGEEEVETLPYVPGFLGFREAPALVKAFSQLKCRPDLIFIDGHGISHPRGLGIASHLGVLLDIPTVGVAKSILVGAPGGILGEEEGSTLPLIWKGEEIACLLRTKKRSKPLIISVGHRVSLGKAVSLVRQCLRGYRLPEPTRQAHLAANFLRRNKLS